MMKRVVLSLATLFALAAASASPASGGVLNETVGLASYPGATDVEVRQDGQDTTVRFSASAALAEAYDFFHIELTGLGWERTELEEDGGEVEATYRRDGRELELELEHGDGRFGLELGVDGDNSNVGRDAGSTGDGQGDN